MKAEALIKALGKDLQSFLASLSQEAYKETLSLLSKAGFTRSDLPFVLRDLALSNFDLGPRTKVYKMAWFLMSQTGAWAEGAKISPDAHIDDPKSDDRLDAVANQLSVWAARTMIPKIIMGYFKVREKYESKVPKVTDGVVPVHRGMEYLDFTLREVLTLRSTWFEDGELLRRVLRFLQ